MKSLTQKQKEILEFITKFSSQHGYSPSYRDVQHAFGFSSPASAFKHVKSLEQKGAIEKEEHKWRSLKGKTHEAQNSETQNSHTSDHIPVIGALAAGKKIELFAQVSTHSFPATLIKKENHTSCYAFLAKDNSFSQNAIMAGDLIAIELKQQAEEGECVLITKNDLAFLGRYKKQNEHIFIDDLCFLESEIRIRGALLTLVRSFL